MFFVSLSPSSYSPRFCHLSSSNGTGTSYRDSFSPSFLTFFFCWSETVKVFAIISTMVNVMVRNKLEDTLDSQVKT